MKKRKGIFLGDEHCPFQDKAVINGITLFVRDWQPDFIWWLGDDCDFYAISKFNKDPRRVTMLQDEIDETRRMYDKVCDKAPSADLYKLGGNHEHRMQSFLWSNATGLSSLRSLQVEELLGIKDMGMTYTPYGWGVQFGELFVIHGNLVSKHSGWTAKAHYEKFGGNGIVGHSHRGGHYLVTKKDDTNGWWENYCLCDLHPEYEQYPNWQQGFTLGYFEDDRFELRPVPIIKNKFLVDGEVYKCLTK